MALLASIQLLNFKVIFVLFPAQPGAIREKILTNFWTLTNYTSVESITDLVFDKSMIKATFC